MSVVKLYIVICILIGIYVPREIILQSKLERYTVIEDLNYVH